MSVKKVQNKMEIEPNHVYVIPAGQIMTIAKNTFKLKTKEAYQKPINEFLNP